VNVLERRVAGTGGIPYVSGYIKSVKAQRQDVLVLDAGDVAEKGGLAFKTNSDIMYQAMGKIGYAIMGIISRID
jgi:2',3'-cyclic-nucleotide 2'-phosphodiesterase (5'-nucleotidase family)